MTGVDTSVLVYCIDAQDSVKSTRALALLGSLDPRSTVFPWQVLVELGAAGCKLARRQGGHGEVRRFISRLIAEWTITMPDPELVDRAIDIRERTRVQYFDALIIASCAHAGVKTLYSEDLPGRVDAVVEGVRVVNPLV